MWLDYYYIVLVLPAVLFSLFASLSVRSTFHRYSKIPTRCRLSGHDAARTVLDANGLHHVRIERVEGELTDHYDPRANVIRLSRAVYDNTSCAAIGVAAHEAGHAIQHAQNYLPIRIRSAIIPITTIGSRLAIPLILVGILLEVLAPGMIVIAYAGVIAFSLCVLFQLVTLPTEFNASRRAIRAIAEQTPLDSEEISGSKKVLRAAAMTYVAALAVSVMQLLRLLLLVSGSRRRN